MKRRNLLQHGGIAGILAAASAPALAQSLPEIKWRLTSSYPKSLDTLIGAAETFTKRIADTTGGKFQIRVHAAGEIVPGLQVLDAVDNATVEVGQTIMYYYTGKNPALGLGAILPFGMNVRQHNAWWYHGGGAEMFNEFLRAKYNSLAFLGLNTGTQMGGWYRKEIKTVNDLKGLKFRVGALAGQVLSKLGVVPQQIAGGDIYPALEKGTIDAAEWVGPYDDEKLGFHKVAKYYYTPGWWEGNAPTLYLVNAKAWDSLPKEYQNAFAAAAAESNVVATAKYDQLNPPAMKKLLASGTQLRAFPREVLDACYKASMEQYAEWSAQNADFKRLYDSYSRFLDDQVSWFRVAESTYDNYMSYAKQPKKK
jgi:TRAP-type mannitol/chloroaromatic compound transport system substrate-binding protein